MVSRFSVSSCNCFDYIIAISKIIHWQTKVSLSLTEEIARNRVMLKRIAAIITWHHYLLMISGMYDSPWPWERWFLCTSWWLYHPWLFIFPDLSLDKNNLLTQWFIETFLGTTCFDRLALITCWLGLQRFQANPTESECGVCLNQN